MRHQSDRRETVVMLTLFQWFELRGGGIAAQNSQKPYVICKTPKHDRDGCRDAPYEDWLRDF
jgi:hypothetical protein